MNATVIDAAILEDFVRHGKQWMPTRFIRVLQGDNIHMVTQIVMYNVEPIPRRDDFLIRVPCQARLMGLKRGVLKADRDGYLIDVDLIRKIDLEKPTGATGLPQRLKSRILRGFSESRLPKRA